NGSSWDCHGGIIFLLGWGLIGFLSGCRLHGVDDAIDKSKKVLTSMSRRMSKNKWILGSVIGALVLAILFILWCKALYARRSCNQTPMAPPFCIGSGTVVGPFASPPAGAIGYFFLRKMQRGQHPSMSGDKGGGTRGRDKMCQVWKVKVLSCSCESVKFEGLKIASVWRQSSVRFLVIKDKGEASVMKLALQARNKYAFVDGSCVKYAYSTSNVLSTQWDRFNVVVLTWIMNSVSADVYMGLVYFVDAATIWKDLESTYDKVDGSIIFNMFHKTSCLKQRGSSLADYLLALIILSQNYRFVIGL
ncbi:hypothetical protein Tco_0851487, partial [Tanacetum coccineum]